MYYVVSLIHQRANALNKLDPKHNLVSFKVVGVANVTSVVNVCYSSLP